MLSLRVQDHRARRREQRDVLLLRELRREGGSQRARRPRLEHEENGVKWKSKHDSGGKIGDERVRTKFAWLPVEADDGYTYWLTPVVVREQLLPKLSRGGFEDDEQSWSLVEAKPVSGGKKPHKG